LIISRQLINIIKVYIHANTGGLFSTLKFAYNVFVDIIKFVVGTKNWFVRCVNCNIIDFYGGCIDYQKHKLDILLIRATEKIYNTTQSPSHEKVLHWYNEFYNICKRYMGKF